MRTEIIAIGDELTSGQRLDTNSQWLAQQLGELGAKVVFHTTIGDRLQDNLDAFRIAASRCELIVSTGGLGPTADDLTRDAIAEAFSAPLEFREEAMQHIESLFAQRKRAMPERNRVQAMFPQGSRLIDNKFGTAPGIDFQTGTKNQCRIFALPGVPAEMYEMFDEVVRPRLISEMGLGQEKWFYKNLRLFGLGESDVEALIPDLIARQREPIVGITVSKATINLRIAALADDSEQADRKMQTTVEEIEGKLSEYIFGKDDDEPWDAVIRCLVQRNEKMAIREYGEAYALAPQLIASASRIGHSSIITDSTWSHDKPMIAGSDIAAHWQLVIGPYPQINPNEAPSGQLQIDLYHGGALVKQHLQPISGHPDIALHRLAKTACKAWLDHLKPR